MSEAARPQALLAADLLITIRRDSGSIETNDVEIHVPSGPGAPATLARQLRWRLASPLLPDELLIIFGKPREWAGILGPEPERLPIVEDPFAGPVALSRLRDECFSGAPQLEFPAGHDSVLWSFGVVLMRGSDRPITHDGSLRIRRAG